MKDFGPTHIPQPPAVIYGGLLAVAFILWLIFV